MRAAREFRGLAGEDLLEGLSALSGLMFESPGQVCGGSACAARRAGTRGSRDQESRRRMFLLWGVSAFVCR